MILDSSALLAVLFNECDAAILFQRMQASTTLRLSAANFLETSVRLVRLNDTTHLQAFDTLLLKLEVSIEPVTYGQAQLARDAYQQYGKGRHPAKLNFGDCFAYALAKAFTEPLLFKGDDFSQTDIVSAMTTGDPP